MTTALKTKKKPTSASSVDLDNPWWGCSDDGKPPPKAEMFRTEYDVSYGLEDFFQTNGVFVNGITGRRCHSDSYMTVASFTALDAALKLLEEAYHPTLEDWTPALRYWLENPNMQPPLILVARCIARRCNYPIPELPRRDPNRLD